MDNIPCIAQTVLACYNLHISTYRNLDKSFHQIHILHSLVLGLVFPLYIDYISVDMMVVVEELVVVEVVGHMDMVFCIVQTVLDSYCHMLHITTYRNLHMSLH